MSSRKPKGPKPSKSRSSRAPNAAASIEWEEWQWAQEYGQFYRYGYNEHGEQVIEYRTPENVPKSFAGGNMSASPEDPVEGLAGEVGEMSLAGQSFPEADDAGEYTHGHSGDTSSLDRKGKGIEAYPEGRGMPGQASTETYSAETTDDLTHESAHDDTDEPFYAIGASETKERVGNSVDPGEGNVDPLGQYPQGVNISAGHAGYGYDADMTAAITESRNEAFQRSRPGQSSHQNHGDVHVHRPMPPSSAYSAEGYHVGGGEQIQGYDEPDPAYEEEGEDVLDADYIAEAANKVPEMPRIITGGTTGDRELSDPRFMLMHSDYWQPGTVFKILWADPQGQSSSAKNNGTFYTERLKVDSGGGKSFYIKLRRFIIYGTGEGQSTCVPIYTYNNQGCKKNGVKPENHGIVYDVNNNPRTLPGEPALGFEPAAIQLTEATEKITKESRVNYSQLMTVQHNVKIFIIGYIHEHSFPTVLGAVDACWKRLSKSYATPRPKPQNPKKEKGNKRHHRR